MIYNLYDICISSFSFIRDNTTLHILVVSRLSSFLSYKVYPGCRKLFIDLLPYKKGRTSYMSSKISMILSSCGKNWQHKNRQIFSLTKNLDQKLCTDISDTVLCFVRKIRGRSTNSRSGRHDQVTHCSLLLTFALAHLYPSFSFHKQILDGFLDRLAEVNRGGGVRCPRWDLGRGSHFQEGDAIALALVVRVARAGLVGVGRVGGAACAGRIGGGSLFGGRAEGPDPSHGGDRGRRRGISVQVLDDEILESAVHGVVGRRGGEGGSASVEYVGGAEVGAALLSSRGLPGEAARETDGPNQLGLLTRM